MGIIVVRQTKYSLDINKKNTKNRDKGLGEKKRIRIKSIMVNSTIACF